MRIPPPRVRTMDFSCKGACLCAVLMLGLALVPREAQATETTEKNIQTMVAQEELTLFLEARLRELKTSLHHGRWPDDLSRPLFAPRVHVRDVGARTEDGREIDALGLEETVLRPGSRRRVTPQRLVLWRPLLKRWPKVEWASFGVEESGFKDTERRQFQMQIVITALARDKQQERALIQARVKVDWRLDDVVLQGGDRVSLWRITSWDTRSGSIQRFWANLFRDVLAEQGLPPETLAEVRRSRHEEHVVSLAKAWQSDQEATPPHPLFQVATLDRHPAISIVDIDADGFDDIYVMRRWGKNLLLRNRAGHGFEEVGADYGLDIEAHTTAALFADFDNDGDTDVFLGRSLAPSLYLSQEDGRFIDRSEDAGVPMPYLVGSLSAADVDRDGLLDIYVATYWAHALEDLRQSIQMLRETPLLGGTEVDETMLLERAMAPYLKGEVARAVGERLTQAEYQPFVDRAGPPNILLRNRGAGRFEAVADEHGLALYRNSFHCAWEDIDDDGDDDVYCANDFAPNTLLRNDGQAGFVDISRAWQADDARIFGMSVGWGDVNADGRSDLFVSNMFSKAGGRVTRALPDLNARYGVMTRGNSLLVQRDASFERVSHAAFERGGWSWGGQLIDFDNDGWLDIYAPNGMFSAPSQVAIPVDS